MRLPALSPPGLPLGKLTRNAQTPPFKCLLLPLIFQLIWRSESSVCPLVLAASVGQRAKLLSLIPAAEESRARKKRRFRLQQGAQVEVAGSGQGPWAPLSAPFCPGPKTILNKRRVCERAKGLLSCTRRGGGTWRGPHTVLGADRSQPKGCLPGVNTARCEHGGWDRAHSSSGCPSAVAPCMRVVPPPTHWAKPHA